MDRDELNSWLISESGLAADIQHLRRWSASKSIGESVLMPSDDISDKNINWQKLILAGSLLAESNLIAESEAALMIGQAAMVYGQSALIRDAGSIVLSQLSNSRAVDLAESRKLVEGHLPERLGLTERVLATRRLIESSIILNNDNAIAGNPFQVQLWSELKRARWTSATAPTAAGKTYLILNWLLREAEAKRCKLGIFLAPTRALVSEIEQQILNLRTRFHIPGLRVASLPIGEFADGQAPTLLVFTQERLHLFMNAVSEQTKVDVAIVDEVQKLSDGLRGVILQDAIERVARTNADCRFVFLSPHAENPESLLADAPPDAAVATVPGGPPTVTQNLILARQVPRKPDKWSLSLVDPLTEGADALGEFDLHARPVGKGALKTLSFVALALGKNTNGTLVYANQAADAEKIASQIYDGLAGTIEGPVDEELIELSDFCRTSIHNKFQLVHLLSRGVAFHYGNMPSILRSEIERLFTAGKIRFLVCTSTLIEGVNLACRTIVVRGPRKGKGNPMTPQDFWNLAGRAGRWGADFHGNIVCIDAHDTKQWPHGIPAKSAYPIQRETDNVLSKSDEVLSYIGQRADGPLLDGSDKMEPVAAYLMAWFARTGSVAGSPSVKRLPYEIVTQLDEAISTALKQVEIPDHIITAHPGISAVALQSLLNAFEAFDGAIENLLPPPPESEDAVIEMKRVFERIDDYVYPTFGKGVDAANWSFAFTAVDWMRGKRLGEMISAAVARERRKGTKTENIRYARIIRDTMRLVEEIARFKAPKYLSAYLDVLRLHFEMRGESEAFPDHLSFELYLEFGVSTQTLLSLIGLGLSRTSAIEMNEYLGRSELTEVEVLDVLSDRSWESLDLPNVVKREIRTMLARRDVRSATA